MVLCGFIHPPSLLDIRFQCLGGACQVRSPGWVEFTSLDLLCLVSQLAPRWEDIFGSESSTQQARGRRKGHGMKGVM